MTKWQDDFEDYYDEPEEEERWEDPCSRCGPWCEHWAGDGLCMLVIEQQAKDHEEYYRECVTDNVHCPVCGKLLTEYKVPTDTLWTWPGDFYNPMIALGIFCAYDTPKGVLHSHNEVYHIWTGEGKYRQEKLIRLIGEDKE